MIAPTCLSDLALQRRPGGDWGGVAVSGEGGVGLQAFEGVHPGVSAATPPTPGPQGPTVLVAYEDRLTVGDIVNLPHLKAVS